MARSDLDPRTRSPLNPAMPTALRAPAKISEVLVEASLVSATPPAG